MKVNFCKKRLFVLVTIFFILSQGGVMAQVRDHPDTLECHIVDFTVGLVTPIAGGNSEGRAESSMGDLYSGPYLDFGIDWSYKYKSGWMATLDADIWFGLNSNNLQRRSERLGDIYGSNGLAMSWGGYDGAVEAYNRGLAARPGAAYIVRLFKDNPNSGVLFKLSGGPFMQKTVFNQDYRDAPVPQLKDEYAKLYDNRRTGLMLTQSVGLIYMSNYISYVNLKLTFDLSECWSWSTRPYQIDNLTGVKGKDRAHYFDLLLSVRLTWMFPFTGKPTYDRYYY